MYAQVIKGTVKDPELVKRQSEIWQRDLRPGAVGYLGVTAGITAEGTGIIVVRFAGVEAARANSKRPEQAAWWAETESAYGGDIEFYDCAEVDQLLGGGSDEAGFVQVMQARAKDQGAARAMLLEHEHELHEKRPDLLGLTIAWHGDGGGFTQVAYFTSEADARRNESATDGDELRARYMDMLAGPPEFYDLVDPELH